MATGKRDEVGGVCAQCPEKQSVVGVACLLGVPAMLTRCLQKTMALAPIRKGGASAATWPRLTLLRQTRHVLRAIPVCHAAQIPVPAPPSTSLQLRICLLLQL